VFVLPPEFHSRRLGGFEESTMPEHEVTERRRFESRWAHAAQSERPERHDDDRLRIRE
jgi:hypothetical protein